MSAARVIPPAPERRPATVNLARRPFANIRHIRRLGIFLWVLGAALLAADGVLYWRSLFGIEGKKDERAVLERRIAEERERLDAAERRLAGLELGGQNVEASYLNERIAERTFPWSSLFDELAGVLPRQVRLYSVSPVAASRGERSSRARRSRATAAAAGEDDRNRVYLNLTGIAESDEALLELLQNLFASPAFGSPSLPNERRTPIGIEFVVNVWYRAGTAAAAPAATPAPEVVETTGAGVPTGGDAATPAEEEP